MTDILKRKYTPLEENALSAYNNIFSVANGFVFQTQLKKYISVVQEQEQLIETYISEGKQKEANFLKKDLDKSLDLIFLHLKSKNEN